MKGFGGSDGEAPGDSDLDSDVDMTRILGSNVGAQYKKFRRGKKSNRVNTELIVMLTMD